MKILIRTKYRKEEKEINSKINKIKFKNETQARSLIVMRCNTLGELQMKWKKLKYQAYIGWESIEKFYRGVREEHPKISMFYALEMQINIDDEYLKINEYHIKMY